MLLFYRAISVLIEIVEFCIIVRILLSFLGINSRNFLTIIIYEITEPILATARGILDTLGLNRGFLDFSPILAFFIMRLFQSVLARLLFSGRMF